MVLIFIIVYLGSFELAGFVRMIAIRRSIIDIPNDRSSHSIPTPRGGGLAVAIAWFAGLIYLFYNGKVEQNLFYALLCGIPLTLIGFIDDIFSIKPTYRFLIQFICAGMALFFLSGLQKIHIGPLDLQLPYVLTTLAFIAIVWSINLFNFLDGIDGYIGTEVVFIGLAAYLLTGDILGILLSASVLGFLYWNWPRAKIFMGDVGSTLLGFTVAVLAIYHQNNLSLSIPVWLILTSVFWFDATVTLFRRIFNKEKLSLAHRKHAYQRIVQWEFSHQKTTLWALVLNIMGFGLAWLAMKIPHFDYLFLLADILLLFVILRWIDARKPFESGIVNDNRMNK